MCEEIKNASTVVPQTMLVSLVINGTLALGMLVAVLFCMGDITAAVQSPTGYPFIEILTQATASKAGATIMTSIVTALAFCAIIAALAGSSRMTWSFARDRGLPGWRYLSKVSPVDFEIPSHGQYHPIGPGVNPSLTSIPGRRPHLHPLNLHRHLNNKLLPPRPHQHRLLDRLQRRHLHRHQLSLLILPHSLRPPPLPPHQRHHKAPPRQHPAALSRRFADHVGAMAHRWRFWRCE